MVRSSYVTDLLIGCRYGENLLAKTIYHFTKAWAYGKRWTLQNFPQLSPRSSDSWEINLTRYSNSRTLLGFSLLLNYFSHRQSPAGIAMLTSASKGRESHQDPLGTTVTCSQSQQKCMSWSRSTLITGCRAGCSTSANENTSQNSSVQITCPLHGETECSSDLSEVNGGLVRSIQISQVPGLAVLVVCSSPAVLVSG